MGEVRILRTDDFTGGLNLRADPFQLAQNESPDMLNVDIDPRGGIFRRGGTIAYNPARIGAINDGAFAPRRLFAWQTSTPQLLVAANGVVYYTTGTTFTSTTATYTAADGASFAPWNGAATSSVYMALGQATAQMVKWSGSASTALTASGTAQWQESFSSPTGTHMPRADFAATHVDRMWVASTYENGAGYPNRVRFSHPLYPESWRSADYIDIVGGGSGITALVPYGGALLVFKKTSVHAIYGYDTDTFQVVMLTESIGAVNSNCVSASERGLYMFSWPDGLFMFDGNGFIDLFEKLRPLVTLNQVNSAATGQMWLSHANNRLWLSLPTGTSAVPSFNYVYDPSIKSWTKYAFGSGKRGLTALTDFVTSTGAKYHLGMVSINALLVEVDRYDIYTDIQTHVGATDFETYYVTRWHDADVVSAKKMWRRPDMIVKQPTSDTTLTVQVYHDWEEATVRRSHAVLIPAGTQNALMWNAIGTEPDGIAGWGQAPWGANAAGSQFKKASNLGLARSVQLKITGENGKPWGVNSISYKYIPRRVR